MRPMRSIPVDPRDPLPVWDPKFLSRHFNTLTKQHSDTFFDDADAVFDVDDLPPCVLSQLEVSHDPESLRPTAPAAYAPAGEPVLPEFGPGAVDFTRVPDPIADAFFAGGGLVVPRRNDSGDALAYALAAIKLTGV